MSALSNYAEKLLLDWMMTTGSATRPTAWFVALYTSPTDDAAAGTEVTGAGYARQAATFSAASSPAGTTSNTNLIEFTATGGNFGVVTHVAILDASSGGNRLWQAPLPASREVLNGDKLAFAIGTLVPSLA